MTFRRAKSNGGLVLSCQGEGGLGKPTDKKPEVAGTGGKVVTFVREEPVETVLLRGRRGLRTKKRERSNLGKNWEGKESWEGERTTMGEKTLERVRQEFKDEANRDKEDGALNNKGG